MSHQSQSEIESISDKKTVQLHERIDAIKEFLSNSLYRSEVGTTKDFVELITNPGFPSVRIKGRKPIELCTKSKYELGSTSLANYILFRGFPYLLEHLIRAGFRVEKMVEEGLLEFALKSCHIDGVRAAIESRITLKPDDDERSIDKLISNIALYRNSFPDFLQRLELIGQPTNPGFSIMDFINPVSKQMYKMNLLEVFVMNTRESNLPGLPFMDENAKRFLFHREVIADRSRSDFHWEDSPDTIPLPETTGLHDLLLLKNSQLEICIEEQERSPEQTLLRYYTEKREHCRKAIIDYLNRLYLLGTITPPKDHTVHSLDELHTYFPTLKEYYPRTGANSLMCFGQNFRKMFFANPSVLYFERIYKNGRSIDPEIVFKDPRVIPNSSGIRLYVNRTLFDGKRVIFDYRGLELVPNFIKYMVFHLPDDIILHIFQQIHPGVNEELWKFCTLSHQDTLDKIKRKIEQRQFYATWEPEERSPSVSVQDPRGGPSRQKRSVPRESSPPRDASGPARPTGRSSRKRRMPDRYGSWMSHAEALEADPESQEALGGGNGNPSEDYVQSSRDGAGCQDDDVPRADAQPQGLSIADVIVID